MPSLRTLAPVMLSSFLGGCIAIAVSACLDPARGQPTYDADFARLGREYPAALGRQYAAAWEAGALRLECGDDLSKAIAVVGREWDGNRAMLFDRTITTEFAKIVPEAQHDADVTPSQRAAMARAWRGFARGLRGQR